MKKTSNEIFGEVFWRKNSLPFLTIYAKFKDV